jgi:hypothetical protein
MAHSGHAARLDSDNVALHLDDRASYLGDFSLYAIFYHKKM